MSLNVPTRQSEVGSCIGFAQGQNARRHSRKRGEKGGKERYDEQIELKRKRDKDEGSKRESRNKTP